MKINALLTVFIALCSFCCHDKVVKQSEMPVVKVENKNDTIPAMNLLDSEYELKERLTDSVLEIMFSRITHQEITNLNTPFYKCMKGSFNGEPAVMNLNFGHLWQNGEWAFEGSLYLEKQQKTYDISGYSSKKYKCFFFNLTNTAENWIYPAYYLLGTFGEKNQTLNGQILDCKNLKQGVFDFKETNTEEADLSSNECFVRKKYVYKGKSKVWEDGREYWVAYVDAMPIALKTNKPDAYVFLKNKLKINGNCASFCEKFVNKGINTIKKTIETEGQLRNSAYSILHKNMVYWNDDDLLVLSKYEVENTALTTYGDESVEFETYDLRKKRLLTDEDVFKMNNKEGENELFDKSIYDYFGWDYHYNEANKIELRLQQTNGFTSKGFYMVGKGNHGWYVSPVFIPYKVVEPFLREDFKKEYWKQ